MLYLCIINDEADWLIAGHPFTRLYIDAHTCVAELTSI